MQSKLRRSNELELKRTANTDDMVKDMIERDRENMEKILYETRSLFKKWFYFNNYNHIHVFLISKLILFAMRKTLSQ